MELIYQFSRWLFQIISIFTLTRGDDPIWLAHMFANGWFNHQLVVWILEACQQEPKKLPKQTQFPWIRWEGCLWDREWWVFRWFGFAKTSRVLLLSWDPWDDCIYYMNSWFCMANNPSVNILPSSKKDPSWVDSSDWWTQGTLAAQCPWPNPERTCRNRWWIVGPYVFLVRWHTATRTQKFVLPACSCLTSVQKCFTI